MKKKKNIVQQEDITYRLSHSENQFNKQQQRTLATVKNAESIGTSYLRGLDSEMMLKQTRSKFI